MIGGKLAVKDFTKQNRIKRKIKKSTEFKLIKPKIGTFFMVREAGFEPARAYCTLEPESSKYL